MAKKKVSQNKWWILGLVIAVALIITMAMYASSSKGTLILELTDLPPGDEVTEVTVILSDIQVHFADTNVGENETSESDWVTVVEGPVTHELISLTDATALLGSTDLREGKYTQIRLNVDSATAVINGESVSLQIPSNNVKIVRNFDITAGQNLTLILDFDAKASIVKQGNSNYRMNPTIKLLKDMGEKQEIVIENNFESKIVYKRDTSISLEEFKKDCSDRQGVFNECGTQCSPDAESCATSCSYVCEFN